jgi:hypothetical protein
MNIDTNDYRMDTNRHFGRDITNKVGNRKETQEVKVNIDLT